MLAAKRMAEEAMALAETVALSPTSLPTLAIMDGSLIMLGVASHGYDDYVRRELVDNGIVRALNRLRRLSDTRPLMVASYVSMPGGTDVANALRLAACPYDTADCERHCGGTAPGDRPCDAAAMGIVDRDLFWEVLEPGQRSAVFGSSSALVANHYAGHEVHFFYVHAGSRDRPRGDTRLGSGRRTASRPDPLSCARSVRPRSWLPCGPDGGPRAGGYHSLRPAPVRRTGNVGP